MTEARSAVGADLDLRSTAELVELMNREDALVPAAVAAVFDDRGRRRGRGGGAAPPRRPARLRGSGHVRPPRRARRRRVRGDVRGTPQVVAVVAGAGAALDAGARGGGGRRAAGARALEALRTGPEDAVIVVSAERQHAFRRRRRPCSRGFRCVHGVRRLRSGIRSRAPVRARDRGGRRPRDPRRLDPAEGGNRAEARPQHDLDGVDDPSRKDVRRPDGRRAPANEKLRERVRSIVREATGAPGDEVEAALAASGGDTKVAIMALLAGVDAAAARVRLDATGGNLREALVP